MLGTCSGVVGSPEERGDRDRRCSGSVVLNHPSAQGLLLPWAATVLLSWLPVLQRLGWLRKAGCIPGQTARTPVPTAVRDKLRDREQATEPTRRVKLRTQCFPHQAIGKMIGKLHGKSIAQVKRTIIGSYYLCKHKCPGASLAWEKRSTAFHGLLWGLLSSGILAIWFRAVLSVSVLLGRENKCNSLRALDVYPRRAQSLQEWVCFSQSGLPLSMQDPSWLTCAWVRHEDSGRTRLHRLPPAALHPHPTVPTCPTHKRRSHHRHALVPRLTFGPYSLVLSLCCPLKYQN